MQDFKRQHFELLGKEVLGRASFIPPFKANAPLENEARFVCIVNGKSKLYIPNNQYNFESSDCFIMKCDNFVNHWFENEDGSRSEAIIFQLYPEVIKAIFGEEMKSIFSSKKKMTTNSVERVSSNLILNNFLTSLHAYFDHPEQINDDFIKLKIRELIIILINSDKSGDIKSMLNGLFDTNAYDFQEIIHTHLYDDLSVEDLAFFAGLSLSTFKRKFKTVFGTSPNQYIKAKRLTRAQHLLQTTEERISDIAYDCGFNDTGYFSKLFKTEFNQSPSEYRKLSIL
ncbi:AraC family transcriptional regulator [Sediminitomix flava]|uniref:AraC-like DNA-binding protein n=1 Tax=Sediminitomix flava TaxID=379075 RepID=A0A315ZG23_SEDFL|nr:AraC family transcriptional regulator [Sediminitomix flava]PWJ43808.1 AraC-like DNA-binding protein [Sediminitomix flava]